MEGLTDLKKKFSFKEHSCEVVSCQEMVLKQEYKCKHESWFY